MKVMGDVRKNTVLLGKEPELKGECVINFWRASSKNVVEIGERARFNNLKIVFKGHGSTLYIGDDVRWTGHILIVGNNRNVRIGSRSTAQGVYLLSRDKDVTIGEDCMLSREIEIRSTDVHKIFSLESGLQVNEPGDVAIGDRVWVAARALISKGANIPSGCVVGACSFVNKKFSSENSLLAGAPAKMIREGIRWER